MVLDLIKIALMTQRELFRYPLCFHRAFRQKGRLSSRAVTVTQRGQCQPARLIMPYLQGDGFVDVSLRVPSIEANRRFISGVFMAILLNLEGLFISCSSTSTRIWVWVWDRKKVQYQEKESHKYASCIFVDPAARSRGLVSVLT